ncbi:hypothetical protein [Mailhella sp.]|uniref:hypothetical protein n=1 Tax=Mailhella sp. TaxID=1981029 RepID=UPI0040635569
MANSLQNLVALSNVSSLSEVHLVHGRVEAQGGLKAAFQKIGDFFRSWTASGRAELASRNERLLSAMQKAVDAARSSQNEQERALTGRLNTVLNRLTEAAAPNLQKIKDDLLSSLRSETRFKALTEAAKRNLEHAAGIIIGTLPRSAWQGAVNAMKVRFYGPHDTGAMMDHLRGHHVKQFSKPTEWQEIHGVQKRTSISAWNDVEELVPQLLAGAETFDAKKLDTAFNQIADATFHNLLQSGVDENAGEGLTDKLRNAASEIRAKVDEAFRKGVGLTGADPVDVQEARKVVDDMLAKYLSDDAIQQAVADADLKRGISQVYIKDTKRGCVTSINGEAMGKGLPAATYINALRNAVGAENARYLPFITTMLSQSGIEASTFDLQKGCGFDEADILDNQLVFDIKDRVNTVERDGSDLIIRHYSRANYVTQNSEKALVFYADAAVTMRIHLDQPPSATVQHASGTAYIPSFSYEGVSLTYGAPQPAEA